jgi:hypothetical protein
VAQLYPQAPRTILVAFYDMHGLQWDYSFPRSPHGKIQRHTEENNILNPCQFGFRTRHRTTLQFVRLTDHVTLNFNNMFTAAVFLDTAKAFDTTWHPSLLYELSELHFSSSLIKLNSFLSHRKYRVTVEGEVSTPLNIRTGLPQGSVLSPTLHSLCINDKAQTLGVYLALFADDTCLYSTDREEGYVIRKLQRGEWSRAASAGTLRLMWRRLGPSTSPISVHQSKLFLHLRECKFPSQTT